MRQSRIHKYCFPASPGTHGQNVDMYVLLDTINKISCVLPMYPKICLDAKLKKKLCKSFEKTFLLPVLG